jgi:hypothetical protein
MSRHLYSLSTSSLAARTLCAAASVCVLSLAAHAQQTGEQATTTTNTTAPASTPKIEYVRAGTNAKLFNLPDPKGVVLTTAEKGTLLKVKEVRGTWLSVEPAGGIPVWIYGKYLIAADKGSATVQGTNVRMRPLPSTSQDSYPLDQLLKGGETLKVLQRADETKPLEKDWVKVLAPAGTIGWMQASNAANQTVVDGAKAMESEHTAALAKLPLVTLPTTFATSTDTTTTAATTATEKTATDKTATEKTTTEKPATEQTTTAEKVETTPAAAAKTTSTFAAAEQQYEAARAATTADWNAVKSAYEAYLAANPKGASADTARLRIEECELRLQIAAIESDKKLREQEREVQLTDAKRRLQAASLSQDPLWGRFQARGWLELDPYSDAKTPRYVLRFGGKTVAEVVCGTGRYDLSQYIGYELGVMGTITRGAIGEPGTTSARPMRLDTARLEVISGRPARR